MLKPSAHFKLTSRVLVLLKLQDTVLHSSLVSSPLCFMQKLPRTHLLSRNISLSLLIVIIQSKKSACALSVSRAISDIMNIPDFCATCFADTASSSVHPTPALNLWTTSDLLTQRPKNSKVLTMKLSASALWQSTAAHFSDVLHWHVNTQRVTGKLGPCCLCRFQSRCLQPACGMPMWCSQADICCQLNSQYKY